MSENQNEHSVIMAKMQNDRNKEYQDRDIEFKKWKDERER
jgi:hypothetical protein